MKLTLLRIPLLLAGDGCGVLVACTEVASASVISMSSLLDGETLGIAEHGVIADADTHALLSSNGGKSQQWVRCRCAHG